VLFGVVDADGNNVFDLSCASCCPNGCWNAQATLDDLIAEGSMDPSVVVIGVYNTADRLEEYTYSKDPSYVGSICV
jgi:hypothetical protein